METLPVSDQAEVFRTLDRAVDIRMEKLVALRRELHAHPELSWQEEATTRKLAECLRHPLLSIRPGPRDRGLLVEFQHRSDSSTPRIALRADIDAIPVLDEKTASYRSQCDGLMHACGHDVHSSVLVGALLVLAEAAERGEIDFPIRLRGIFQPAEEVAQGAQAMIAFGAIDDVQALLSWHVDPMREVGNIGLKAGIQTAQSDEVLISVRGRGGHGARPHETNDPIFAAVQFVNAVYSRGPRCCDARSPSVISFCQISGGASANVVPSQVDLRGTIRTLDKQVRSELETHLIHIARGIGQATQTEIEVRFGTVVPSVDNAPELVQLFRTAAVGFLGPAAVQWIEPSMGSEDLAFYLQHVPGAMARVGCASREVGSWPLHSSRFDADDQTIRVACRLMLHCVLRWCNPTLGAESFRN